MCNKLARDIVLRLRRDLKETGNFSEEVIERVSALSVKDAEDVNRLYGFNLSHVKDGGRQLEGLLRFIDCSDRLVLEINKDMMYFRTGHGMYYREGKLCLACPLEQKISIVNIGSKEDVSRGVNNLMDIVREDCPKQQFYQDDASKIVLFERNVEECLK